MTWATVLVERHQSVSEEADSVLSLARRDAEGCVDAARGGEIEPAVVIGVGGAFLDLVGEGTKPEEPVE